MSDKVLLVDDDPYVLDVFSKLLRTRFETCTASSGEAGLEALAKEGPFAVVVADMVMPGMTGAEFLRAVKHEAPDAVRVMLTGNADQQTAIEAVNEGQIYQFLNKPCTFDILAATVEKCIQQHKVLQSERNLLESTLNGSIRILMEMVAAIEPETFRHSDLVRSYVQMYIAANRVRCAWELELAAMLARIGHVTLPPAVLRKVGAVQPLSAAERGMVNRIPELSARLLANIPRLEAVSEIILYQNKNFDGSGFPQDGAKGSQIPLGARILRVVSDLTTLQMSGSRKLDALRHMQTMRGTYDPEVLQNALISLTGPSAKTFQKSAAIRFATINDLKPGDVLAADVEASNGMLLVPAGTEISAMILEKTRNFAEYMGVKEPLELQV